MDSVLPPCADRPCRVDQLGFDHYIDALSGMIRDPAFQTPFCIGVFGPWGSGKTSFMQILHEKLQADRTQTPAPVAVWFNPWRFQKEAHLIIPFLKTIESSLQAEAEKERTFAEKAVSAIKTAAVATGEVAAAMAYGLSAECSLGLPVTFTADAAKMADRKTALKAARLEESKPFSDRLASLYYNATEALQAAVSDESIRIVAFIDDLDRCLPEKAVELLEAMKLFLDIAGYVFVLGLDRGVVKKGIAYRYRHFHYRATGKKEAVISPENYLEKMIQLPIALPPVEAGRKRGYIVSLLGEGTPYADHADLMELGVGDNPRTLKRFVNFLSFTARLADGLKTRILSDENAPENHRKLAEGHFVPALYMKWSIIVFRFQETYRQVRGNPDLLIELQTEARNPKEDGKAPEAEEREPGLRLDPALKSVLAYGPPFPSSELVRLFLHLVRLTVSQAAAPERAARGFSRDFRIGDWALVPAGPFLFGDEKEQKEIDTDFEIGAFPVTCREFKTFLEESEYEWKGNRGSLDEKPDHPVVEVSHEDATSYCKWLSEKEKATIRLPTEEEWEKAARGEDGRQYPWGDEFDSEKCNTKESGIGSTTAVTQYPGGQSPYGCRDMAGNVWEWTSTKEGPAYILKGGSWGYDRDNARCALRFDSIPTVRYTYLGFRCVRTK